MTVKYSSCWLLNSHGQVISHVAKKLRLFFSPDSSACRDDDRPSSAQCDSRVGLQGELLLSWLNLCEPFLLLLMLF